MSGRRHAVLLYFPVLLQALKKAFEDCRFRKNVKAHFWRGTNRCKDRKNQETHSVIAGVFPSTTWRYAFVAPSRIPSERMVRQIEEA